MPKTAAVLGEWLPDQPGTGLSVASNVKPVATGYAPVRAFQAITGGLGAECMGGGAFVGSDGTASFLGATPTGLMRYSGTTWSSIIGVTATARWRFAQFGDNVIASSGGYLTSYNLVTGTAGAIASSPSNCIDVATVRDFVLALRSDSTVEWCEFNNSAVWGTGNNQADTQPLLDGGEGVAIVGGEYALILQKNCVRRFSYVAGDVVFQNDVISAEIGCMTQGSVCNVGRMVGFLSERGFQICNGTEVTPIGDEKFNRWFFSRFSREDIVNNIWAAVDPQNSLMIWAMPGEPGTLLAYNWVLQRASVFNVECTALFTGFTANTSLDALDALYPEGLDSVDVSLDDAAFQGGNPLLIVVDEDYLFGTLSGENMNADLRLENVEPAQGRRSRIRSIRPDTDVDSMSVTIDARMRAGDSESVRSAGSMRLNGKMPIRSNGRYNDIALTIPRGEAWSYVRGLEIEFEAGDGR